MESRIARTEDMLKTIMDRLKINAPPSVPNATLSGQSFPGWVSTSLEPWDVVKSDPHSYQPLDAYGNVIRLLVLSDGANDAEQIKCGLVHLSLDDKTLTAGRIPAKDTPGFLRTRSARTSYAALSYTWGDMQKKASVNLDGHQFPVTTNLEAALRQMRKRAQPPIRPKYTPHESYWWIDANCVNQEDLAERNRQVAIMRKIYKSASSVQVWLGEAADQSEMAMNVISQPTNVPKRGPGEPEIQYPTIANDQKVLHWKTIAALLQRPWWERVWVRQEIAVAQSITFHCGDSTCTFQDIGASVERLTNLVNQLGFEPQQQKATRSGGHGNPASPFKVSPFVQADLLHRLKYRMGNYEGYMDLKNLMFHTRSCKATDLRDKIFSILGLADPDIHELQPDYHLSVNETFVAATCSLISKTRSLDFFSACQNPERLNGLPLWVPNLLDNWRAWPFEPVHQLHQVPPNEEAEYTFDKDSAVLRVTGSYLDSIDATSTGTVSQDDTFEELNALFDSWKTFAQDALSRTDIEYMEQRYISEDLLGLEKERP